MPRFLLSFLLLLLLGGCSSVDTQVSRTKQIGTVQRFFVIANSNDSRALDRHIVNALRARGFTAESGPRTMKPDDAQAVVNYQDNWTWDFGDRLMYLQIQVLDAGTSAPIGTVQYGAKIPGRQPLSGIVSDLIGRLFGEEK